MSLKRLLGVAATLAVVASGLTGCNQGLKAEHDRLYNENLGLRDDVAQLNEALDACEQQRSDLLNELSQARIENRDLLGQLQEKPAAPEQTDTGFGGIQGVGSEFRPGEVAAIVEGDVLFDSGQVTLKAASKSALDRIASVLNSRYSGRAIRVEGHTDSDPIKKSKWVTNDRLSCERAMAVKEYLQSRGVAADRLYVAGFGSTRPAGSKAKSRRVEIVVILGG